MKLKTCVSLILTLALSVSLAACGSSPAPAPSGPSPASSTPGTPGTSGEKVTIELWHYFPDANVAAFDKIIDDFNSSQDRIEVKTTFVARADLMKQYAMGAISGELPDIGMTDSPDMASFVEMGIFEDITDLAGSWGELDQFLPGPLSSCKGKDGKLYGLPQNANDLGFFYNKDLLKAAGYENPPQTWEELSQMCEELAKQGVFGLGLSLQSTENATFQFYPFLYGAGGSIEEVNSPAGVKALTLISELYQKGYISPETINWAQSDVVQSFIAGKTAMVVSGPWNVPTIQGANVSFEWGACEIPMDKQRASVIGGENLGICKGTEHKEEAFEVLSYIMGAQANADYAEAAGRFPVRQDSYSLKSVWTDDPLYSVFAEIMNYAVARGPHPEWSSLSEALYSNIQASVLGEKTPEQALNDAAAVITPLFAK